MENIKQFQDKIASAIKELDIKQIIKNDQTFNICCSDLDDGYTQSDDFKSLLCRIEQSLPTIYWFEITSSCFLELKEKINVLRDEKYFKVPPERSKYTSDNILYVGKVIKDFRGRVSQHLGYRSNTTWSLQLKHWAKDLTPNLNLKLHYIQFNKEKSNLSFSEEIEKISLAILEQCVAEELKPILGKHSL